MPILGVDYLQEDSAFLESGFVSVFFIHVYMHTFYNWLIFDVENHVQHHPLVPYISDKSQLKFWSFSQSELLKFTQVSCSRNLVRYHPEKKNGLASWSSEADEQKGISLNIYHGRRCVYGYIQYAFFWRGVNAGWFMRSKSSRENSPVWEMLPETMWEAHRPCFLQIVGFQPSKDLHLGLPRYMYVYIHIFTLCNIA